MVIEFRVAQFWSGDTCNYQIELALRLVHFDITRIISAFLHSMHSQIYYHYHISVATRIPYTYMGT